MNDTWSPRQEERNSDRAKSILIIEDDTDIRDVLKEVFQEETIHQVFLAQDGKTALDMLQTATPQVFLLDYRLPDMNGLELIDHVRRMRGYEQTPILLMSASLPWENISRHRIKYVRNWIGYWNW